MHETLQTGCQDSTLLLTFLGNHDTARFAALVPSLALRKNAFAYTLLSDGIPNLYQGDEQSFAGKTSDPDNREALWLSGFDKSAPLYQMIRKLNKLRSWAGQNNTNYWTSKTSIFWSDAHTMAMRRGSNGTQIVAILTNSAGNSTLSLNSSGNSTLYTIKLDNTGFGSGTVLMDVVACEEVTVGRDGVLSITMTDGNPKVFYPVNQLSWSGICHSKPVKPKLTKLPFR